MSLNIRKALTLSHRHDHRVRARACLTTAQAFQAAAQEAQSKKWYAKTHIHCTAGGDSQMLSAMMHNMAWLSSGIVRQAIFARTREVSLHELSMTASDSVANLDGLLGSTSLNSLVPLLQAQMMVLRNEPQLAGPLFERCIEESKNQGLSRLQGTFLSDLAWCRAKQGWLELALDTAMAAENSLSRQDHQVDDLAATHSRLQLVYELLHDPVKAEHHAKLAARYWDEFAAFQAKIIGLLAPIDQLIDAQH